MAFANLAGSLLCAKCPFHGNGRVYVVSEAAALRQFLCFLPVLGAGLRARRIGR